MNFINLRQLEGLSALHQKRIFCHSIQQPITDGHHGTAYGSFKQCESNLISKLEVEAVIDIAFLWLETNALIMFNSKTAW